ncbi:MAG: hypothetical protein K0R78_3455, partial [Pelosinus sp.]|nr:hypothetical protein [Pelosinus sp.]
MIYRRVDRNYDYTLGSNRQNFIADREAVGQAVSTRLKNLYQEWWEDTEDGLPLFEQILGVFMYGNNKQIVDQIIQKRIQETLHVTGISNFTSEFDNQTRKY